MTLIVPADRISELLTMKDCIAAVENGLRGLETGTHAQPLRFGYKLPQEEFSILASMPSFCAEDGKRYAANKVISVFPQNVRRGKHSHQGAIMLFEAVSGDLVGIVDASEVTAIRTAAASAVATRLLAREESVHLALIGSGAQATVHLAAMLLVRPQLRKVTVWSRTAKHLEKFVATAKKSHPELDVCSCASVQDAVSDADIICTLTAASAQSEAECLLKGVWVKPGAHVNAVGACTPSMREIDTNLVRRSTLITDSRESCLAEPGDIVVPLREGKIQREHIKATLGDLLQKGKSDSVTNAAIGRSSSEEITLFESLGLAVEDLASALVVYRRAIEVGEGGCSRVALNGSPQ